MFDFTNWTVEELETRRAAIVTELDKDGADLDKLDEEAIKTSGRVIRCS